VLAARSSCARHSSVTNLVTDIVLRRGSAQPAAPG
jgi:hypothetical protein